METVSQQRYLGTILDDTFTFEANIDYFCKKANQRLFSLRKLRCFNVDESLLKNVLFIFHKDIFFIFRNLICWFCKLCMVYKNRLGNVVEHCQKTIGTNLNDNGHVYRTRATHRAKAILADPHQSLHVAF